MRAARFAIRCGFWVVVAGVSAACDSSHKRGEASDASPTVSSPSTSREPAPELLYLPDGGDVAPPRAPGQDILPGPWGMGSKRCPEDMVDVQGRFCVDRYEASLVDVKQAREISPYYHPARMQAAREYGRWQRARLESEVTASRDMAVPVPPAWQLKEEFEPRAVVKAGVIPNGYVSGDRAAVACAGAGKRLCTQEEWVTACRGEKNRKFPYGDRYEQGRCNVFREAHPAQVLHGNASINHLDPRLLRVRSNGKPLLRKTGETPECKSEWGSDAIYDMVGNLDEWIDEPKGRFCGGFFSRSTREGCDASVSAHPPSYYDYSLGVRCCK
ncbi:MAG: SUMF1/EgtB/PvdO family nonheme iron enzyme [Myxococcales bacterium]|nr:SUMF1/EgtB/PvdO family nonheme iron enzyme [Myxococcales bacterium]